MKRRTRRKTAKLWSHTIPPDAQTLTFNVVLSRDRVEADYSGQVARAARLALERLLTYTTNRGAAYACKIHDAPQSESYTVALSVTAATNCCWTCLEFARIAARLARYFRVPWVGLRLEVSGITNMWYVSPERRMLRTQNGLIKSAA